MVVSKKSVTRVLGLLLALLMMFSVFSPAVALAVSPDGEDPAVPTEGGSVPEAPPAPQATPVPEVSPAPEATSAPEAAEPLTVEHWEWIADPDMAPENGTLALPGAAAVGAGFEDVAALLPAAISCEHGELSVSWSCPEYPAEPVYEGEYTFTAQLPEGYVLSEGAAALQVQVELGGAGMYAEGGLPIYFFLAEPGSELSVSGYYADFPNYTGGSAKSTAAVTEIGKNDIRGVNDENAILKYIDLSTLPAVSMSAFEDFGTQEMYFSSGWRGHNATYSSEEYDIVWSTICLRGRNGGYSSCYCDTSAAHVHIDGLLTKRVDTEEIVAKITKVIPEAQQQDDVITFQLEKLMMTDDLKPLNQINTGVAPIEMKATIKAGETSASLGEVDEEIGFGYYRLSEKDTGKWQVASVKVGNTTANTDVLYVHIDTEGTMTYSTAYNSGYKSANEITITNSLQSHVVSYDWGSEVPDGVTLPTGRDYIHGATHVVDKTYTSSTVIELEDGRWIFSGWDPTGDFAVEADTVITGAWTYVENQYLITYTDGVSEQEIFADEVYTVDEDGTAAFAGSTERAGFHFLSWSYNGATYTTEEAAQVAATKASGDIVFTAVWEPYFTGIVELLLNGRYNADETTAVGERHLTAEEAFDSGAKLYLRNVSGGDAIELAKTGDGYSYTGLSNGNYNIYYSLDNGMTLVKTGEQLLSINNADRTGYLFFYSVKYVLNGGTAEAEIPDKIYMAGTAVKVTEVSVSRGGYTFGGWMDPEDSTVYAGTAALTGGIARSYELSAQWADAADIFINVTIKHDTANSGHDPAHSRDDISLDLVSAQDASKPYLETGDSIVLSKESHSKHEYTETEKDIGEGPYVSESKYLAAGATFTNLQRDLNYTVVTSKTGYDVESIVATQATADNGTVKTGDWVIDVVLTYAPKNQDLAFIVTVDEETAEELVPDAAIVKVLYYNTGEGAWKVITQQEGGKPGVRVNIDPATRSGSGSYPVWVTETLSDATTKPYAYRIAVSAVVYPDGTIVPVNQDLASALEGNGTDLYRITLNAEGGELIGSLDSAYLTGSGQQGTLEAEISTAGYSVTFDAAGGKINGSDTQKVSSIYKVPAFSGFVPVREGGYVFEGWYTDAQCTVPGTEGVYLAEDITLYAKWKEPLTINGTVTIAGFYNLTDEKGITNRHEILDADRGRTATVYLQTLASGAWNTLRTQTVTFSEYAEDTDLASAQFAFENIPDDGREFRISVDARNYSAAYRNEPESISAPLDFESYTGSDNHAAYGEDKTATINAYLAFDPATFPVRYQVDAKNIGTGFRPATVDMLVTYYDGTQWAVISQMILNGSPIGKAMELIDGIGADDYEVWNDTPAGSLYYYATELQSYTLPGAAKAVYGEDAPFAVTYQAPAAYSAVNGQTQELIARLSPKSYPVTFDMGLAAGETVANMDSYKKGDSYETTHIWSYETAITAKPEREGYLFSGWYLSEDCSGEPVMSVAAGVQEPVTLYAGWIRRQDAVNVTVIIDHAGEQGGQVLNLNKSLLLQLTAAAEEDGIYTDVENQYAMINGNGWYDEADNNPARDIYESKPAFMGLSSEYFYSVNASLYGYYETDRTVSSTLDEDGDRVTDVTITLKYNPALLQLDFTAKVAADMPAALWPTSVEVKVTSFYTPPEGYDGAGVRDWNIITQHKSTSVTIPLGASGSGKGTYPVWMFENDGATPYYYRAVPIAITLSNGETIPMSETSAEVSYASQKGGYTAEVVVAGGLDNVEEKGHMGVYGVAATGIAQDGNAMFEQQGTIEIILSAAGYAVTLDPNGGTLGGQTASRDIGPATIMPEVNGYVPVKAGYEFIGWSTYDGAAVPAAGTTLNNDVALYAQYKAIDYTIDYVLNGGTLPEEGVVRSYSVETEVGELVTPTYANHCFLGWFDVNGEPVGSPVIPTGSKGNRVFTAKWEADFISDADEDRDNDPENGDGVPDCYQAVVQYVAGVGGSTAPAEEVVTLRDASAGNALAVKATVQAAGATAAAEENYAFDLWSWDESALPEVTFGSGSVYRKTTGTLEFLAEGGMTYVFRANFAEDTVNTDKDVPDKYEFPVTFKIENGTWQDDSSADITVYLIRTDANGDPSASAGASLSADQIPVGMKPAAGYENGTWINGTPSVSMTLFGETAYTYGYDIMVHDVEYKDSDKGPEPSGDPNEPGKTVDEIEHNKQMRVNPNGGAWRGAEEPSVLTIGDRTAIEDATRENHVFMGWKRVDQTEGEILYTLVAQWEQDIVSDPDEDDDDISSNGDGVPDIYQVTVKYAVADTAAGKIADGSTKEEVFTLKEGGKWVTQQTVVDEDGSNAESVGKNTFDYWTNSYENASFNTASAATGALTVQNAAGGMTYTFTAHFTKDSWKDDANNNDSDDGSDGIADYRQFVAYFNAAAGGTVSGSETVQVFTLEQDPDTVTPAAPAVTANDGYAFDYWSKGGQTGTPVDPFTAQNAKGNGTVTYTAHFAEDSNDDGVPDKYQTTVTYKVEDGSWSADITDTQDKVEWYDLYKRDADTGWLWEALESVTLGDRIPDVSGAKADAAQGLTEPGHWGDPETTEDDPASTTPVTGPMTYIYQFSDLIKYAVTIQVTNGTHDQADDSVTVEYGKDLSISFTADEGYALESVTVDGESAALAEDGTFLFEDVKANHSISVIYGVDQWNDEEDKQDAPDGTPDSLQVRFLYESADETMGTVEGKTLQIITVADGKADPEEVTVSPIDGWLFDQWIDEQDNAVSDPFEERTVEGGATYTYRACFKPDEKTVIYDAPDTDNDNDNATDPGEEIIQKNKYILVAPNGGIWNGSGESQKVQIDAEQSYRIENAVRDGYVFMGWLRTDPDTLQAEEDIVHVFTALWEKDVWCDGDIAPEAGADGDGSDGVPDRYQVKVNYIPSPDEFGTVTNSVEVHTLLNNGIWAAAADVALIGSTAQPKTSDNEFINWTDSIMDGSAINTVGDQAALALTLTNAAGGSEYTYYANFRQKMQMGAIYFVQHLIWDDATDSYIVHESSTEIGHGYVGDEVTATSKTIEGYAFNEGKSVMKGIITMPTVVPGESEPANVLTLKLYYEVDTNGGSGGDNVPDIWQKPVTFRVVNGTWSGGGNADKTVWLTLLDENGKMSPSGKASLKEHIPGGMIADSGFMSGAWDIIPPETVEGTNSELYTFRFNRIMPWDGPIVWPPVGPNVTPNETPDVGPSVTPPKTGDTAEPGLWLTVLLGCVVGLAACTAILLRSKKKGRA